MRHAGQPRRRIYGVRGWLVLAALLGLFAMHGLSAHGSSTQAAASTAVGGHGGHAGEESAPVEMPTMAAETGPAGERVAGSGGQSSGHHHLALIGLCLAVLAGARTAYALLRRRLGGSGTPAFVSFAELLTAPAARRFRDPPCLFRLAVQRC